MKKKARKMTARVLIIVHLLGWIILSLTFLDDMNWHWKKCVCGGELSYPQTIGSSMTMYECNRCRRNYILSDKNER